MAKKLMAKKYQARMGAKFTTKEAQMVGTTLESLRDSKGHLTPNVVLDYARDHTSKLHKYFEWSNTEAAEKYRIQQARELVNHVVEVRIINKKKVNTRAFVSVTDKECGKVYVTFEQGVTDNDYRKQLISKALHALDNLKYLMEEYLSYQD